MCKEWVRECHFCKSNATNTSSVASKDEKKSTFMKKSESIEKILKNDIARVPIDYMDSISKRMKGHFFFRDQHKDLKMSNYLRGLLVKFHYFKKTFNTKKFKFIVALQSFDELLLFVLQCIKKNVNIIILVPNINDIELATVIQEIEDAKLDTAIDIRVYDEDFDAIKKRVLDQTLKDKLVSIDPYYGKNIEYAYGHIAAEITNFVHHCAFDFVFILGQDLHIIHGISTYFKEYCEYKSIQTEIIVVYEDHLYEAETHNESEIFDRYHQHVDTCVYITEEFMKKTKKYFTINESNYDKKKALLLAGLLKYKHKVKNKYALLLN